MARWSGKVPIVVFPIVGLLATVALARLARERTGDAASVLGASGELPEQAFNAPLSDAATVRVRLNFMSAEISLDVAPGTRIEPMFIQEQLREWDGGFGMHLRPNRGSE
jgi:hypothetical protein